MPGGRAPRARRGCAAVRRRIARGHPLPPADEGSPELEAVHGVHPVRELLEARRRDVERLFVLRERAASVGRILRTARQAGVPVSYVDRQTLVRKVGPRAVHQGIAAVVTPLPYADADELAQRTIDDPSGLLVLVDRVEDAGNLGAILRTAGATGAVGVLLSADATVGLTAGVARASAGAAERVPVAREARPSWRIGQLRAAGVRTVVLDPRGDVPWDRADLGGRLLVVAGGRPGDPARGSGTPARSGSRSRSPAVSSRSTCRSRQVCYCSRRFANGGGDRPLQAPDPADTICRFVWAGVAQPVEQRFCKPPVGGSNPFASSTELGEVLARSVTRRAFRRGVGGMPEWLKGADCKSAGLRPTEVRILPPSTRSAGDRPRRAQTEERGRE